MAKALVHPIKILKFEEHALKHKDDLLAVEEPLEIRLGFGPEDARKQCQLSITMRTPGHDFELVMGFLFCEGIINSADDLSYLNHCKDDRGEMSSNVVRAELKEQVAFNLDELRRNFYTNSSCGICGKASIEHLESQCSGPIVSNMVISAEMIQSLGASLRDKQMVFSHTGGLHAAGLFDQSGNLLIMREDIGRHNALDKLIGSALGKGLLPLKNGILKLSGRSSFELIQKSVKANIPIVIAVGAPSSLAVETAEKFGQSLIGFNRNNSFNIYSGSQRIIIKQN